MSNLPAGRSCAGIDKSRAHLKVYPAWTYLFLLTFAYVRASPRLWILRLSVPLQVGLEEVVNVGTTKDLGEAPHDPQRNTRGVIGVQDLAQALASDPHLPGNSRIRPEPSVSDASSRTVDLRNVVEPAYVCLCGSSFKSVCLL